MHEPWRGVELRHLATLTAVADTGSFDAAAALRGYAPSAVSQQVAQLERVVGRRLVERRRGRPRVELTADGARLAERGRAVTASLEAARADVRHAARAVRELRVAIDRPLVESLVPAIATAVREAPVRVVVDETDAEDEPALRVERGLADVGIGAPPAASRRLAVAVIDADEHALLVRADDGVARRPVTLADLLRLRLLVPGAGVEPAAHLHRLGVPPSHLHRADPREVGALVRTGAGAAVVSALTTWGDETGLARVGLGHLLGVRTVAMAWQPLRRTGVAEVGRLADALPEIRRGLAAWRRGRCVA